MYARASLIRGTGLVALTLSMFYGCGGLNEADVYTDASALHVSDAGADGPSTGRCGDGKRDRGEACDGRDLGGNTCASASMITGSTGTLGCTTSCVFNFARCSGVGGGGGTGGTGTGGTGGTGNGTGGRGRGGRGNGTGGAGTAGAGTAGAGGVDVQCTSNGDCQGNQICCGVQAGGQLSAFQCQARCGGTNLPTECAKASDCASGQVCCGTLNANQNGYTAIACAATCAAQGGRTEIVLCTSNADCAQGTTCQGSRLLPSNFQVCR